MTYVAIMSVVENRAAKLKEFATEAEAKAHVAAFAERWPDAFVVEKPSDNISEWWVDGQVVTIVPVPAGVPDRVTSRQFKLTLHGMGLLSSVESWVNGHPNEAVKIAYDNSGTFVRTEPMMAAGFAALGFSEEQIDAFFTAAAAI